VEGSDAPGGLSHIRIRGYYLLRRNQADTRWIVQITPQVRIGPEGSPETLAHPVEYYLPAGTPERPAALTRESYDRILERVYFSVASKIYEQLQEDIQRKIDLLPTDYFRATAYFHEAQDYARSNTLFAYERARAFYEAAMRLLDPSSQPTARTSFRRGLEWAPRQWGRLQRYFRLGDAYLWPGLGRVALMLGQAETGYANMLLYRRVLALLSGQRLNPIYESRPVAERAVCWLGRLSPDVPGRREALFDAYVTQALAWTHLGSYVGVEESLQRARQLDPRRAEQDSRYLFVRGLSEPRLLAQVPLLRQAVEQDQDFEVAQFQLACASEMLWRTRPTLEAESAQIVFKEYERVLALNPGNLSAWANLGYMHWLLAETGDSLDERARYYFYSGRDYKEITGNTFVAELDYGLARIAAERGEFDLAYRHFESAASAYIAQGLHHAASSASTGSYYFDFMEDAMWQRMKRYRDAVERHWLSPETGPTSRIRDAVYAFVLNDYGEACFHHFRHSGNERSRSAAEKSYQESIRLDEQNGDQERNVIPLYNFSRLAEPDKQLELAEAIRRIEPDWWEGVLAQSEALAVWAPEAKKKAEREFAQAAAAEQQATAAEREADELRERRDKLRSLAMAPGPQLGQDLARGPRRSAADRLEDQLRGRRENAEQLWRDAGEHQAKAERLWRKADAAAREAERLALSCLPQPWLLRNGELDWQVLGRRDLARDLVWERELDELQVRALLAYAKALAVQRLLGGPVEETAAERAERLLAHLGEHFLPRDSFDTLIIYRDLWPQARYREEAAPLVCRLIQAWTRAYPASFWPLTLVDDVTYTDSERLRFLEESCRQTVLSGHTRQLLGDMLLELRLKELAPREYRQGHPGEGFPLGLIAELAPRLPELKADSSALAAYRQAAAADDIGLLLQLVERWQALGLWPDCACLYRKAMKLDGTAQPPLHSEAFYHFHLAHTLCAMDRHAEALAELTGIAGAEDLPASWRTAFVGEMADHVRSIDSFLLWKGWLEAAADCADRAVRRDARQALLRLVRERYLDTDGSTGAPIAPPPMPLVVPIELEGDPRLFPKDDALRDRLAQHDIPALRERIRSSLGVTVPPILIRRGDDDMVSGAYLLSLQEIPVAGGTVFAGEKYHPDADSCRRAGLDGRRVLDPVHGGSGLWLAGPAVEAAEKSGRELLDCCAFMVRHLESLLRCHLTDFFGLQEMLETLDDWAGKEIGRRELQYRAVPDDAARTDLLRVLQGLLRERVSIADLETILASFAAARERGCNAAETVESVRLALRPCLPGNDEGWQWLYLSPEFEAAIAQHMVGTDGRRVLVLPPEEAQGMAAAIRDRAVALDGGRVALVLRQPSLRPFVRRLVEVQLPAMPILSEREQLEDLAAVSEPVVYVPRGAAA
jgi:FHIPEP family protein